MDYVTRQFIVLAKKLRDDVRKSLGAIHADIAKLVSILSQQQADAANAQHKADEKENRDEPRVVRAELSTPIAITVKNEPQDSHPTWERVKTIVEIVGILAAIFYAYMAVRQWREMISSRHQIQFSIEEARLSRKQSEKALDATITQFHLDQRAWVSVKSVKMTSQNYPNAKGMITISLTNTGKTPAWKATMVSMGSSTTEESVKQKPPDGPKILTVAPNADDQFFVELSPGESTVTYIKFSIKYWDVFQSPSDKPHTTTFCGRYDPTWGISQHFYNFMGCSKSIDIMD
jgi:hypothetical protein